MSDCLYMKVKASELSHFKLTINDFSTKEQDRVMSFLRRFILSSGFIPSVMLIVRIFCLPTYPEYN